MVKKRWLWVVVVSVIAVAAWRWHRGGGDAAPAHDDSLVVNRLWIDHLPRNDRDTINVFLAIDEESVGVFQASSAWHGVFDIFRFEHDGDQLRLVFPHDGAREQVRAKARRCDEGGMDFCMELAGSKHGVKRYYSMKGWEIDGHADPSAAADKLLRQIDKTE
jgi:hypothetical protein